MSLDMSKRAEVIDVLGRWYRALEVGIAHHIKPNLEKASGEDWGRAKSLPEKIDAGFKAELKIHSIHWEKKGITEFPNFSRLRGGARLAFYQDLYAVVKDIDEEDLSSVYLVTED